ncbi:pyridoxal phosphate-dependent aminotransferase [Segetibacter aerophilus]|uniref:Aspartate aminotransferase n=1 Tax=Segetibacter aerophilus TaxID=670293 RepID=A0A512BJ29_9BACT|nr:aminotransferase class I/II-fold pyridoxal phosphate-dependent enzyme [Segetibacter aerophilus]GEO11976.1 aspartate aminotransferase [Segetibacter aerophilus]
MKLSNLAETLIGSEIVKLGNAISERKRQGEKIYNFTIGDFDPTIFPIPKELEDEIIEAYKSHYTNYPPADGIVELRNAVSSFLKDWEGLDYSNNEILIAAGGRPLIYTIFKTIVDKGDKVIYATPSWNNNHYVHMTEGVHCMIDAKPENNFMPLAADIALHINGATLLCLCSPQNPTGTTLRKEELEKICNLVIKENKRRSEGEKKLYVLYDQMYWTLTYGDTVHYNPVSLNPAMKDYTIFVDGISKVFAATGVRVGWSLGPAFIIAKMKAILSHLGAWSPMPEQKATAKYLLQKENIQRYLVHFKAEVEERLRRIYEGFIKLKEEGFDVDAVSPQAAIYLTIKLDLAGKTVKNGKLLESQSDVTDYLLSEAKLAVVPFYAFGAEKNSPWYRLSVGTCKKEEINEMIGKLREALTKLV